MSEPVRPVRGDVWWVDLDPRDAQGQPIRSVKGQANLHRRGHEQLGVRPGLVLSRTPFNLGPVELVIVAPITKQGKGYSFQVPVMPPEGGLVEDSFIMCEAVRSVSRLYLLERMGEVSKGTLFSVETKLKGLLEL